jgi:hypothetical protein
VHCRYKTFTSGWKLERPLLDPGTRNQSRRRVYTN